LEKLRRHFSEAAKPYVQERRPARNLAKKTGGFQKEYSANVKKKGTEGTSRRILIANSVTGKMHAPGRNFPMARARSGKRIKGDLFLKF